VLADAATVTATALAQRVRRIALALDPGWAERRYHDAVRERRVIGYLNEDGTATVSAQRLDAAQAAAACARIDTLAAAAKRAGASATTDQLRVELFLGLLDARFHGLPETAIITELLRQYPRPTDPAHNEPSNNDPTGSDPTGSSPAGSSAAGSGAAGSGPVTGPGSALVGPLDAARAAWPRRGVSVRVGLGTLLGLDEQPGELPGWGTITATVARRITAAQHHSQWRYAILDDQGRLLYDGLTRRRPHGVASPVQAVGGIVELHVPLSLLGDPDLASRHPDWAELLADLSRHYATQQRPAQDPAARFPGKPLRRHSQIAFQSCIFPGCRRPALDCEQDHRREHARGGRTDAWNLAPACGHDHDLKTTRGWRLTRRDEHTFLWISPLGRRHVVQIPALAPPLPSPQPRPPDPNTDHPSLNSAYDNTADTSHRPTFNPVTQHGLPLTRPTSHQPRQRPDPTEPEPPPF
jgi:HNH endonuclease